MQTGVPGAGRQGGPQLSGTLSGYWSPQYIFSVYIRPSCTVCACQGQQLVSLTASCITGRSPKEMHPRASPTRRQPDTDAILDANAKPARPF